MLSPARSAPSFRPRLVTLAIICLAVLIGAGAIAEARTASIQDDHLAADLTHPDWFKDSFLDLRDDLQQAVATGKRGILVFFSTRTCSYCQVFLDTTFADPEIVERVQRHFDVIGIDVMSDLEVTDPQGSLHWAKDFAVQEQARFTPTLVFYGAEGLPLLRLVGHQPPDRFRRILDYLEDRQYETRTLRAYLHEQDAEPSPGGTLTPEPGLFSPPPYLLDRRAPGGRPLLVLFEQSDCQPCREFHRTVLQQASIRTHLRAFEVVQLDLLDDRSPVLTPKGRKLSPRAWAGQLQLIHAPALVFFDETGNEVLRLDAETGAYRLEGALQYVLEKAYLEMPQFQHWRRQKVLEDTTPGSSLRAE
jgi:thioredoxin-related protein